MYLIFRIPKDACSPQDEEKTLFKLSRSVYKHNLTLEVFLTKVFDMLPPHITLLRQFLLTHIWIRSRSSAEELWQVMKICLQKNLFKQRNKLV